MVQNLLHVRDEQTANVSGGTPSVGVNTRVLNTVVTNTISGASLASNQITLATGTYEVEGYAPVFRGDEHRLYLYNITDAADEVIGNVNYARNAGTSASDDMNKSPIRGRFTIAGNKVFELRHQITSNAGGSNGLGLAVNDGRIEIYADVTIREILTDVDILHVRDEKSAGVTGGSSANGENIRILNIVVTNEIAGASLASNTVTLPAGTYQIEANAPNQDGDVHKLVWRNKTDSIITCFGHPVFTDEGMAIHDRCYLYEQFIISSVKDFELVHDINTVQASNGLGRAINDGRIEIYADVMLRKLI